WKVFGLFLLIVLCMTIYHQVKPLPKGTNYASEIYQMDDSQIQFLSDLTYQKDGKKVVDQEIFKEVFQSIEEAKEFIILDMFLVNSYANSDTDYPPISETLTSKIKKQMQKHPDLKVIFITDEINSSYGSHEVKALEPLKKLGAQVVITDLDRLRDPNILYSGVWRTLFSWFGQAGNGWVSNPIAENAPDITLRSYLKIFNLKANHRKVLVTENNGFILSANPHNASAYHSNIGFKVKGEILQELIKTEKAVVAFSGGNIKHFPKFTANQTLQTTKSEKSLQAQIVTEGKIQKAVIGSIESANLGETIWVGMFYLADREIIQSLESAAIRGVHVNLILDPNHNAFGQGKMGLPNRPISAELEKIGNQNITIRWYNTGKEQYHSKMIFVEGKKKSTVIGGSANYTFRNLDNFNMEADLKVEGPTDSQFIKDVHQYFARLWKNEDAVYTLKYDAYQDEMPAIKYSIYVIQKLLRLTTY
ncbi:MAG TPA: phospholipase D family protein, partial [Pseudoneobacillus sp.]|nr:phospholipase D family protein [Pseudoneobacillus sp.]